MLKRDILVESVQELNNVGLEWKIFRYYKCSYFTSLILVSDKEKTMFTLAASVSHLITSWWDSSVDIVWECWEIIQQKGLLTQWGPQWYLWAWMQHEIYGMLSVCVYAWECDHVLWRLRLYVSVHMCGYRYMSEIMGVCAKDKYI